MRGVCHHEVGKVLWVEYVVHRSESERRAVLGPLFLLSPASGGRCVASPRALKKAHVAESRLSQAVLQEAPQGPWIHSLAMTTQNRALCLLSWTPVAGGFTPRWDMPAVCALLPWAGRAAFPRGATAQERGCRNPSCPMHRQVSELARQSPQGRDASLWGAQQPAPHWPCWDWRVLLLGSGPQPPCPLLHALPRLC